MARASLQLSLPPEFLRKDARRPIVATVFDASGLRLPGCQVEFLAEGPGGFTETGAPVTTERTDHDGDALATWRAVPFNPAIGNPPVRITARCTESRAEQVQLTEAGPPPFAWILN